MASNNEAKIKFSADTSEFNNAIKDAKNETKQLNAEMRLNEATFKNTGDAAEYLATKHDLLQQKLEANQKQQEALNDKIEVAKEYYGEDSDEVQKLEMQLTNAETAEQKLMTQIDDVNSSLDEQSSSSDESMSALDQLTQTITDQETELAALKDEYTNAVLEFGSTSDEAQTLASEIENLSSDLSENKASLEEARSGADEFDKSLEGLGEEGVNVSSIVPGAFGNIADSIMTGGIAGLVAGITDNVGELIQAAWDMANEWQESQASIATGTGLVGDELDDLTAKAYEAAGAIADINFDGSTASEVIAELNTRLGLTGDEAEEATVMMAEFAKANGEDAAAAVDDIVNVMHKFGLETEDLPGLLDKLTVAQQGTQYSASDMAGYLEKNATALKGFGYDIDDSLALMMAFADYSGVSLPKAASGLTKAFATLSETTDDVPGAFEEAIAIMQSGKDTAEILDTEIGNTGKTIKDVFGSKAAGEIVEAFAVSSGSVDGFKESLENADGAMHTTYDNTVSWKDQNAQTMNAIKGQFFDFASNAVNSMQDTDKGVWEANSNMSMSFTDFGNTTRKTKDDVSTNMSGMSKDISTKTGGIKSGLSSFANDAKNKVVTGFSNLKSGAQSHFDSFKTSVTTKAGSLKSSLSEFASTSKSKVTSGFSDLKSGAQNHFENLKSSLSSKAESIKQKMASFSQSSSSSVTSAFSTLKSNASTKMSELKSSVGTALENIKSKFNNLKLKLPKPSLPSISLKMSSKTIFGKTFSYPSGFNVSWNAEGVIFNRATILMSRAGLQGVGEAGPEAVAPISKLQDYVADAVRGNVYIDYDLLGQKVASAVAKMDITMEVNSRELGRVVRGMV